MAEKIYMVLHDSHKNGRNLGAFHMKHEYADSGVARLQKLTVWPGPWRPMTRAIKMPNGSIWVSTAELGYSASEIAWYPLQPLDWDVWQADYDRNEALIAQLRREAGER
jgi:hypothetical protein